MTIEKISDVEWEWILQGDWEYYPTSYHTIEATNEGIVVGGDLISWEDLDRAKAACRVGKSRGKHERKA
jgi:hypothetical protein